MSVILKRLGFDNTATQVSSRFLRVTSLKKRCKQGNSYELRKSMVVTRINLKLRVPKDRNQREQLEEAEDFARLVEYFEENLQDGDVFLAGNAGNGMDHSAYTDCEIVR